jgi:hypothetical protein
MILPPDPQGPSLAVGRAVYVRHHRQSSIDHLRQALPYVPLAVLRAVIAGDDREAAVNNLQLATVRLQQGRYAAELMRRPPRCRPAR